MKTNQKTKRMAMIVALACFLCLSISRCFGKFELTRKIYYFNQRINNDKWIQWVAFLGMNVIPI